MTKLQKMLAKLDVLREMAQKRAGLGQTAEDVLYSFGEVSLFIGMIRDISEALEAAEPASDALKELSALLHEIAADPQFAEIEDYVKASYDLTPNGIIGSLHLKEVDYNGVSAYGHFGRLDIVLPWETIGESGK